MHTHIQKQQLYGLNEAPIAAYQATLCGTPLTVLDVMRPFSSTVTVSVPFCTILTANNHKIMSSTSQLWHAYNRNTEYSFVTNMDNNEGTTVSGSDHFSIHHGHKKCATLFWAITSLFITVCPGRPGSLLQPDGKRILIWRVTTHLTASLTGTPLSSRATCPKRPRRREETMSPTENNPAWLGTSGWRQVLTHVY